MKDFTIDCYKILLASLIDHKYTFYTFEDIHNNNSINMNSVILRHDVDRLPKRALAMAQAEKNLGVKSTYFFRTKTVSFNTNIIKQIYALDHNIGYHYENLADTNGDNDKAWLDFKRQIQKFENIGCPVKTIAMHGRPLSKWNNLDLWDTYNYKQLDLIDANIDFESSFDYFTDVCRRWDNNGNIKDYLSKKDQATKSNSHGPVITTLDLIKHITTQHKSIIISTHPER